MSSRIKLCIAAVGLSALGLFAVAQNGETRQAIAASIPTPKTPVRPTQIGINTYILAGWASERNFANLAIKERWRSAGGGKPGWPDLEAEFLGPGGWPKSLPPGARGILPLDSPQNPQDLTITCTYSGKGTLSIAGINVATATRKAGLVRATLKAPKGLQWIDLSATDPSDPIRDIDCREPSVDRDATFYPEFVSLVGKFKVVRFMDWQNVNRNLPRSWDNRSKPGQFQVGPDGVAVEYMVELANKANVSPWFTLPYNADPQYIRGFAQYIHDNLKPGLIAHFELGNEIWNGAFPASRDAAREGQNARLSADGTEAKLLAYAIKSQRAMEIVTDIFKDNPQRVVRIVSSQHAWPRTAEIVLSHKPLLPFIDALATAPYFSLDVWTPPRDLDTLFRRLNANLDEAIATSITNRQIAYRHGKRFIAYEAGQHITADDASKELVLSIQRDPRMGAAYARYLDAWNKNIGDLIVLYALTSPAGSGGSWGLRERTGQPVEEAPKLKAVLNHIGAAGS